MNDDIKSLLEELVFWTKFSTRSQVRDLLQELLTDKDKKKTKQLRLAYETTEPENTQKEIAKMAGVTKRTIQNWHSVWAKHGIIRKSRASWQKIISLNEVSIALEDKDDGK